MKLSGFIVILLFVSFVFLSVGIIVSDIEKNYPDTYESDYENQENITTLQERYSFEDNIETEMEILKDRLESFSQAETGWETFKAVVGMIPVPFVIMYVPAKVIGLTLVNGYLLIEDAGSILGIPKGVIGIGVVALLVIVIFKLISWWHAKERI
jgi:hypothetical protein